MSLSDKEAQEVRDIIEKNLDLESIIGEDPEEAVDAVMNELNEHDLNQSQIDKTKKVVRAFAMAPTEELRKLYEIEGTTPEQRETMKMTWRILIIIAPETVDKFVEIINEIKENHQEIRQAYRDGEQQLRQVIDAKL